MSVMDRTSGIGGSDVAAILGLSSWESPWSLWAAKVGLTPPKPTTPRQRRGQQLERAIAEMFQEETGMYVAGEQMELCHPRHAWARGHADGLVFDGPKDEIDVMLAATDNFHPSTAITDALGGFEAKTDGRFAWPDGIPPAYQCQAQWYMLLSGLPRWWFAVLFAGFRFEVFELEANPADQALIARRAARFWHKHCLTGDPPPIDGSEATERAIGEVWPEHTPDSSTPLDEMAAELARLTTVKAEQKALKAERDLIENRVKAALGECEEGTIGGERAYTFRTQERAGFTVEPSTFRVLRASTPKKARTAA